ncbi:MAG: 30S ribosomal protein S20 [Bacilli bacterium]|jgi:small subunit ribosomal protein S20|nr:30S ribosomal protein S20 [Bacilli bacterium]
MPNIKSQKKRTRTNEKKRLLNSSFKSSMRTAIKKVKVAVEANDLEQANIALAGATKKLDKAQTKGILHKNNVAHKKSQLATLVNTIK